MIQQRNLQILQTNSDKQTKMLNNIWIDLQELQEKFKLRNKHKTRMISFKWINMIPFFQFLTIQELLQFRLCSQEINNQIQLYLQQYYIPGLKKEMQIRENYRLELQDEIPSLLINYWQNQSSLISSLTSRTSFIQPSNASYFDYPFSTQRIYHSPDILRFFEEAQLFDATKVSRLELEKIKNYCSFLDLRQLQKERLRYWQLEIRKIIDQKEMEGDECGAIPYKIILLHLETQQQDKFYVFQKYLQEYQQLNNKVKKLKKLYYYIDKIEERNLDQSC